MYIFTFLVTFELIHMHAQAHIQLRAMTAAIINPENIDIRRRMAIKQITKMCYWNNIFSTSSVRGRIIWHKIIFLYNIYLTCFVYIELLFHI